MPDKVTLVRPDGTLLDASPEQAQRLALLGYKEEGLDAASARLAGEAKEEYFSSPLQKVEAGIEGIASGLTFGATDYISGALGSDVQSRAQYNPGTRLASETLGALVPLILSEGASAGATGIRGAAKFSGPRLLADAAEAATSGVKGGLTRAVAKGAIEGSIYGAAGSADHAYLSGDPITSEAVFHGLGWGAVIGGAFAGIGHGIQAAGEAAQAAKVEANVVESKAGNLARSSGAEYSAFRNEVSGLAAATREATVAADATVNSTIEKILAAGEHGNLGAFGNSEVRFVEAARAARPLYDAAMKAAEAGKFTKAADKIEQFSSVIRDTTEKMGVMGLPDPSASLRQLIEMKAVARELESFPKSVEGFASMSSSRAERFLAAVETARGLPFPNAQAMAEQGDVFAKAVGIDPAQGLRSTWRAAKAALKNESSPSPPPAEAQPSLLRKAAGYVAGAKAYSLARGAGLGHGVAAAAFSGAKSAVTSPSLGTGLATIRNNVVGRIREAAASYLPTAGKAVKLVAPRISPLSMSLFGTEDRDTRNQHELALRRVQEIAAFSPVVQNTVFKAVEPLSVAQPDLAAGMHKAGLAAFTALAALAPKDPGVLSKLASIWKPSDIESAVLSRQLAVFHDPVGQAVDMMKTGAFDPIKVQALRDFSPSLWQEMRVGLLNRITQPGVREKLSYQDQAGLSAMLDISIHSSMEPGQIATSQQMFLDRNKPLAANPRMGQGGGMPNPSDNVNSTSAQRSTER